MYHEAPHRSGSSSATGAREHPYRSQHVVRTQTDQLYVYGGSVTDMRFHPYPDIHSHPTAASASTAVAVVYDHNNSYYSHHHYAPPPLRTPYSASYDSRMHVDPDHASSSGAGIAQPLSAAATPTTMAKAHNNRTPPKRLSASSRNQPLGTKTSASYRRTKRLADETQRRRRRTQACQYCHAKKIKCEGDGERCNSCIKNDIKCKWGEKQKRGPKPKLQPAESSLAGDGVSGPSSTNSAMVPGSTHYITTASGMAAPHSKMQQKQQQKQAVAVPIQTSAIPDAAPYAAFSARTPEHPMVEEDDFEYEEMRNRGDTPDVSDGGGGEDDYDYDDDMYDNTVLNRLQAPRMDRELEEFFSDKVDSITRDAVVYYFNFFYPLAPMFHPSMFIRRLVNNDVDPLLLDAMKATTARVIKRKTGRVIDGNALAQSVKSRILVQLETPTIDLIQVIVVMTLLAGSRGEHVSYNSLICLAASLVVKLGWHQLDLYKRPPPTSWNEWVDLEVRRRVFWLVYQTDSYQAMLTGRPMSISEDSVYVSAPCSDFEWDVVMNPTYSGSQKSSRRRSQQQQQQIPDGGNAKVLDKVVKSAQNPRSSRSSSGSAASLGQSMRVDQHTIVATGAFSYSFMALCELTAIISRINTFLCDAKSSRPSILLLPASSASASSSEPLQNQHSQTLVYSPIQQQQARTPSDTAPRDGPFPAVDFLENVSGTGKLVHPVRRTVELPSEYPKFMELDERLEDWKNNLVSPEELRDDAAEAADITYFGNADHRRFMMRVRYFCLHCYYVPITLFLHQSNRPSFFTEYEQPRDEWQRSGGISARQKKGGPVSDMSPSPPFGPAADNIATVASGAAREHATSSEDDEIPKAGLGPSESDTALRQMLDTVFARTWNSGLLAYDIEARSWAICVHAAHGLSEHLDRNSDMPLERFDQVIPFCIFMSVSVLIRQVRLCNRKLRRHQKAAASGDDVAASCNDIEIERARCIRHAKHQWELLQSLGSLWDVKGMQALLKSMHIDQVTSAADLLGSMSL
ncbi:hypothetical protein EV175_000493 [Coemansia sp. RSA 1933]|nr:hypothetical protein EV175_000493 [Coemansia sp. RSA 1933]